MGKLSFTLIRKELDVEITAVDGTLKAYKLKEFSGVQRKEYLAKFNMDISFQDGKAVVQTAKDFKPLSETEFLALCLYNEKDEIVPEKEILEFPSTAIIGLHKAAQELSGFEDVEVRRREMLTKIAEGISTDELYKYELVVNPKIVESEVKNG